MPKLTFLSHDVFLIEYESFRLIIDPFLTGNPKAPVAATDIKVDYVLLTHGHGDHLGDGIDIALANNATIIAPFELATYCQNEGCLAHAMHIGGGFNFPFGRVKLTIAHHGSAADLGGDTLTYMGNPCGFVLSLGDKNIYHAGDTGLFLDMQLIGELTPLDVALLPIGDNFTMGIDDAVKATEFLKPKLAIPMHYRTFDVIMTDPEEFQAKAQAAGFSVRIMDIGETIEF
jgi:L-ascorbate metabolism protein UlaG (beta-lactamase superfamily)